MITSYRGKGIQCLRGMLNWPEVGEWDALVKEYLFAEPESPFLEGATGSACFPDP